jgi:hypothetical protein
VLEAAQGKTLGDADIAALRELVDERETRLRDSV